MESGRSQRLENAFYIPCLSTFSKGRSLLQIPGGASQAIKLHFQLGNHNIEPGQLHAPQRVRSFFETVGEPLEDLTWLGSGRRGEGYRVRSWGIAPVAQAFTDAQTASTFARTPFPRGCGPG
jgi:hypothetical protein